MDLVIPVAENMLQILMIFVIIAVILVCDSIFFTYLLDISNTQFFN